MDFPIKQILIQPEEIQLKIQQLAKEIKQAYQNEDLILLSILKGSVVFLVDLMKQLDMDIEIGFMYLSSYQGETSPQRAVREFEIPCPEFTGRNVILIEDILDTGASLNYAWNRCMEKSPKSLKTCILLVKEGYENTFSLPIDFRGFNIPRVFVVGYGLDYREKYRHLPYIGIPDLTKI